MLGKRVKGHMGIKAFCTGGPHCLVFLLLVLFPLEAVVGKAQLFLRFVRFNNPGGKGDNGHCCDGRLIFCPSKCDHRFVICLDRRYGRPDTFNCPYGKKSTREIRNQDSIVFGRNIGGVSNPMVFEFDSWPGETRVKIGVWDRDRGNSDDLVDFLKVDITSRPSPSRSTARWQRFSVSDRVSLDMDVMLCCSPGSYGRTCDVVCQPRNDNSAGYTCDRFTGRKICRDGWTGENCDASVDDCVTNQCQHGASCLDGHQGYTCVCAPGYAGQLCDEDINECLSNPCQNGGTCHDDVNGFTCSCGTQWTGSTCQMRDACNEVTCNNGGTCFNVDNTFSCKCRQGFAGTYCEIDVNECLSAPCQNDGTCSDNHGSFLCTCGPGWTGVTCDIDIDECAASPCENARRCIDLRNDFSCVCDTGYTGKKCDTDINECLKQPCQNGGICANYKPGFRCDCLLGFYGDRCENDVDECLIRPCKDGSTCVNVPGSFKCLCPPDFTGPTCDSQIDNCQGQICEHNGTCIDDIDDFQCACTEQFTGRKCGVYIDRCLKAPCQNGATCRDPGYGHRLQCQCGTGWTGSLCDQDNDECLEDPCVNGATCVNTPGTFICQCPDGWTGPLCEEDVNECQLLMDKEKGQQNETALSNVEPLLGPEMTQACQHAGVCANVDGDFMCICLEGWQGKRCQDDVDECMSAPCQNGGVCSNTAGGFHCACGDLWSGKLCDTKEYKDCESFACPKVATCVNTLGGFQCVCPSGWQGDNCDQDIDECRGEVVSISCQENNTDCSPVTGPLCLENTTCVTSEIFPCKNNASCRNTPGSFSCSCSSGWSGPTCDEDIDECTVRGLSSDQQGIQDFPPVDGSGLLRHGQDDISSAFPKTSPGRKAVTDLPLVAADNVCLNGAICQNAPGSFSCACTEGWSGFRCQDDVDECKGSANPCQNHGHCINYAGGFNCSCVGPWEGQLCSQEIDECRDQPCKHNGTCVSRGAVDGGGVQCVCRRGWQGLRCEEDRNECDMDPCLNGGTCVNEISSFQCLCPNNVVGRTCSNNAKFDKGVVLPLYLQGYLGEAAETQMTQGIKVYLQQHGDFRHDITIRAYVQAHKMTVGSNREPVTKVTITIMIENVTLTEEEVADLLSRVPLQKLETYFPLPIFAEDVEHVSYSQSRHQQTTSLPWYIIVGAVLTMVALALMAVYVANRRGTVRWWPRKRSDTRVIFSRNGNPGSTVDSNDGQAEYTNTLPEAGNILQRNNTQAQACGDDDGRCCRSSSRVSSPRCRSEESGPSSQAQLSGLDVNQSSALRAEAVWSHPKEVQLRRTSCSSPSARDNKASSCQSLARSSESLEEESPCFVNTVYMTIDDSHHPVEDPGKRALPPPPTDC